jgi:hypothetical protein
MRRVWKLRWRSWAEAGAAGLRQVPRRALNYWNFRECGNGENCLIFWLRVLVEIPSFRAVLTDAER